MGKNGELLRIPTRRLVFEGVYNVTQSFCRHPLAHAADALTLPLVYLNMLDYLSINHRETADI